jgi:FMN-dependent NADH-azoreductase
MKNLLVLDSSPRAARSKTRGLTRHYASAWLEAHPGATLTLRDLGAHPPSCVDEGWIAAAFAPPEGLSAALRESLRESETLIGEIERADAVVMGVPMYNFGFPASLKAWFDQVTRIGRTFELTADPVRPYRPLLRGKSCHVAVSASDGSLYPGGAMAHLNFLEPYLKLLSTFIGLDEPEFVRVVEEEPGPRREAALRAAEREIGALARGESGTLAPRP